MFIANVSPGHLAALVFAFTLSSVPRAFHFQTTSKHPAHIFNMPRGTGTTLSFTHRPIPQFSGQNREESNQKTNKNNIHTYYISFIINIYNTEYRIRISREYAEMHLILILLCYYILCMRKAYIVCASMN